MKKMKLKVFLLLDHAPDYREPFLRKLAEKVDLTVAAQNCSSDDLQSPARRDGYIYKEVPCKQIGFFRFEAFKKIVSDNDSYDIFCVSWNPRQIGRMILFLKMRKAVRVWVWWGAIFGRSNFWLLKAIRKALFNRSDGALVYADWVKQALQFEVNIPVSSFNNSVSSIEEFNCCMERDKTQVRLLFVGRPHARKRIDCALKIAMAYPDVKVRLVGPNMFASIKNFVCNIPENVEVYDKAVGLDLKKHICASDIFISPGDLGLMISSAAQHGKPVAIQKGRHHGPEIQMARDAKQIEMDFDSEADVRKLIDCCQDNEMLARLGKRLYHTGLEKYNIERMVEVHLSMFDKLMRSRPG